MKRIIILLSLVLILVGIGVSYGQIKLNWGNIDQFLPRSQSATPVFSEKVKVASEESLITDVVDKVSPSVVTISIVKNRSLSSIFDNNAFDPFSPFQIQPNNPKTPSQPQDIGTGFIVSPDGLIVTNKHVVSDTEAKYKVVTKDDKTYEVTKIYRDPINDMAVLKINASNLQPVTIGDSSKIKVGQMAIAIGTALGEFRNTVTVGVISGVGRGITAGGPFESSERLDNVIQTDAAINPGNSGGPLLNSSGQVIGMNTAVSAEGQNIGFALPINLIKDALDHFQSNGGNFARPFLGVHYKMITKELAVLNEVPEGAYVQDVVTGSPADKAGIQAEDIITKIDGAKLTDANGGLAKIIADKKVGDRVSLEIWRDSKTQTMTVTIGENSGN